MGASLSTYEHEDSASVTKIKCNREKRREPYHLSNKQEEQNHLIVPPTDITVPRGFLSSCLQTKLLYVRSLSRKRMNEPLAIFVVLYFQVL